MSAPAMTRAEKVAELRRLRNDGLSVLEAGARLGLSKSGAYNLLGDPDGAKQRARRKRYQGRCEECGASTDGVERQSTSPSSVRVLRSQPAGGAAEPVRELRAAGETDAEGALRRLLHVPARARARLDASRQLQPLQRAAATSRRNPLSKDACESLSVSALPLFEPPPPEPKLGARQQLVHEALLDGGWLTDAGAGLLIHLERGCRFCRPGAPCRYAAGEGRSVLASLRPKVGLVRRKTGRWELKTPQGGSDAHARRDRERTGVERGQAIGNERQGQTGGYEAPADRTQDRRGVEAPSPPTASALTEQAEEAVGASDARPGDDPEDGMSLGEWMQLGCP